MKSYWVSCNFATGQVDVTDSEDYPRIIKAPAIWGKFTGQPFSNLLNWLSYKTGSVRQEEL